MLSAVGKRRRTRVTARLLPQVIAAQDTSSVMAITSLGDNVYVLRWFARQLEVYDTVSFTHRRNVEVPGLGNSWGLAACDHHNYLYVSDSNHDRLHRVDPSGR